MSYINPDILQEDWDALGDWENQDNNGAVSEIDPAGQLYLDCREMTDNGNARRFKDIGTLGSIDYYVEIKFKGDIWDASTVETGGTGVGISVAAGNQRFFLSSGNGDVSFGDGIFLHDGAAWQKIFAKTWDDSWHTIVLFIHNNQTDMDIWIDKDPRTEAADVTDAVCATAGGTDGYTYLRGWGSVAGNGEYHIDYLYVGSELMPAEEQIIGPFPTFFNP